MRKVLLLGASGNIGAQSLDIIRHDRRSFELVGFSVGHQSKKIPLLLQEFPGVKAVYLISEEEAASFSKRYPEVRFFYGEKGLCDLIRFSDCDIVENALVGFCGFLPSLTAIECDKVLCLANKESLVVGGSLIKKALKSSNAVLYPIDSEHVALAKCLRGVDQRKVKRLVLTGSGGAFRAFKRDELAGVNATMALKHPTWRMGAKITIDCATMFNKGFEVVEAMHLFDFPLEAISIVLHDESHVHSYIEMDDGTLIGDVGEPDMHGPIAYALYEGRIPFKVKRVKNLQEFGPYHFRPFDEERYPAVPITIEAARRGGNALAALNAAVECADRAFLEGKMLFLDIEQRCLDVCKRIPFIIEPTPMDIVKTDEMTREAFQSAEGES